MSGCIGSAYGVPAAASWSAAPLGSLGEHGGTRPSCNRASSLLSLMMRLTLRSSLQSARDRTRVSGGTSLEFTRSYPPCPRR